MSFPTQDTIFGTIIYKDKKYDILNNPLEKTLYQKITQYKKDNDCVISTAPWNNNKFQWIIEDDELYLVSIKFKLCQNKNNLISEIFNIKKLFASWLNDDVKLLISKKEIEHINNGKVKVQRDILILKFSNGILIDTINEIEEYKTLNLEYYIGDDNEN